ncbi:glycosyltransferase family 9 protein [Desulfonatronovibrio magnus]|uniref:glycosyltransferase family 9 protein n=1 Tax=Desulfonatronovibrio magnus TaxID=698827 RepID=UPI0005EB8827|nr:glycosyltransferase family 9 protein [Desulfonatronovibrio magnus]
MTYKRIGVWQTAFLGDTILTLPLLQTLKSSYPGSEIHFFVRKGLKTLFENQASLIVHEFDKHGQDKGFSGIINVSNKIRKIGLDLWISPHTSFRSACVCFFSRPGLSIGYSQPFFNNLIYHKTIDRRFHDLEEIERLLRLVKPLNINAKEHWPQITLSENDIKLALEWRKENISGKAIGIHPGSTWPTKMWPLEYFAQSINLAMKLPDTQIVMFAGPGESTLVQNIISKTDKPDKIINLAGQLSLAQLAARIGLLDCYLTNDSGPMHLAWPQNVPVVAIFGPTTKDLGFFPRGPQCHILEYPLPCRPCGLHGHKSCPQKHHECMKKILPETVFAKIKEILGV